MAQGGFRFDPTYLPTYNSVVREPEKRGWLGAGLSSGVDSLQGLGGSALQGFGQISGISPFETLGRDIADRNELEAQQNGRPDLEIAPWNEGGADVLPWLGYQTAKQVPQLLGYIAAGAVAPEAAVPAFLSRAGAVAPKIIGGGGLRAGADFAARRAAQEVGTKFGQRVIGAQVLGMPLGFGAMYQEADNQPEGATTGDAIRALAMSPLYAGLDALTVPMLSGLKSTKGNIASKVIKAGLLGAAEEIPQEGVQTAMEVSFRPDMSTADKMSAIVDGALTGGAVGGVLGGFAGVRRVRNVDPSSLSTDNLSQVVDEVLGLPSPEQAAGGPLAPDAVINVGADGVESMASASPVTPSEFDVAPSVPRPFEGVSTEELTGGLSAAEKKIDAGTASPEVENFARLALEELSLRDINGSLSENTADSLAGVVEPDLASGGAQASEAPTPATQAEPDLRTRLSDVKRVPASVRDAISAAGSNDELLDIAHREVIEVGKGGKWREELGQRTGLLDADGKPTALATEISTRKTNETTEAALAATPAPVAPASLEGGDKPVVVSPRFQKWWDKTIKGSATKQGYRKSPDVQALNPTSKQDLEKKVYAALGGQDFTEGMERIARDLNILDQNNQLTPHGAAIARQSTSMEEAVSAAVEQGFTGLEASAFDLGARSVIDQSKFMEEGPAKRAYIAGRQWGVPKVASAQWSEAVARDAANTDVRDAQYSTIVGKVEIPELQRQQRTTNRYIDNLRGIDDGDRASLKQMAKGGATKEDIDNALAYIATGRGALLREQPPAKPFRPVSRADIRGSMTGDMLRRQEGERRSGRTKAQAEAQQTSLVESAKAIKQRELGISLRAAFDSGDLNQLDFIRLTNRLQQGDFAAVLRGLPGSDESLASQYVNGIDIDRAPKLQQQWHGKHPKFILSSIASDKTNTPFQRHLARKIRAAMIRLEGLGMHFEYRVAAPGTRVPVEMLVARGLTERSKGSPTVTVWLKSADYGGQSGMSTEVALHEFAHAVTMTAINRSGYNVDTPFDKAVDELIEVSKFIQGHLMNRMKAGTLNTFEQRFVDRGSNAFENEHEILAWALTNPEMQAYLDSIQYGPDQTLWEKFLDALLKLFGLETKDRSALAEVLRVSEIIIDEANNKLAAEMVPQRESQASVSMPGSVSTLGANLKQTVKTVTGAADALISRKDVRASGRRGLIGWNSMGHLGEHYYDQMPAIKDGYNRAHFERRSTAERWAQLFETPYQAYEKLAKEPAKWIRQLMGLTEFEIDPTKTWSQHPHLHGMSNAGQLKKHVEEGNKRYNDLRRSGASKIYDDFRAINEATHYAMMAVSLHNLVSTDPSLDIPGFERDPSDIFRESADIHESPQEARAFWRDALEQATKNAGEYVTQLRGEAEITEAQQRTLSLRLSPVELRLRSIRDSLAAMEQAPYFHLGRFGDHFVSFHLRTGKDGKEVDPKAIDHVAKAIRDAGYTDLQISRDSTKPKVYARVDSIEAREQLHKLADKLKAEGWLSTKPEHGPRSGPRSIKTNFGTAEEAPAYINRLIQELEASPMFQPNESMSDKEVAQLEARKREVVAHIRELYLDMLPDTALSKVMVHRNAVPGFNEDMVRNFAFRFQVGVNSLATLSMIPKMNAAFTEMRDAVNQAQTSADGNIDLLNDLYNEVAMREAERPLKEGSDWIDKWRALNHAYFLGFSPSYAMINLTQLGVLLWPELGKKHSFVGAAKAIGKVTPMAFNILKETFKQGGGFTGKRSADAIITSKVLIKAGVPPAKADFLMRRIASGEIDIGGSSRELSRVVDASLDSNLDNGLRYAAAIGLYSETFTRLVAALSAYELHGNKEGVDDYAKTVINESMLNYANWNTARQMGKGGMFGKFTPVMFSFLQYSAQVMEKLYREMHTAFMNSAKTDKEKAEARRFLASHATAVMTVAGTLGLPFATVAATAVEKLVDLFDDDDEPYDATAAWRNLMSSIFGKEIGEIASRGMPRALGLDLSQRAGEQGLLPFTQLIADRRNWKDATTDFALRSAGAPVSMGVNILTGGEKISDGDLIGGMKDFMPSAIKGPIEAYRMTEDGYKDSKGNVLPLTPGANDLLVQVLGFSPSEKAEYSEARGDQAARRGDLTRRATMLRSRIAQAIMDGDMDTAGELIGEAQKFDQDNPAFAVMPDIEAAIRRRIRSQSMAATMGAPVGVSQKDLEGQSLTNYANIDYRAQ